MKIYTEKQVKELLDTQRGNCYVAILNHTKDEELAKIAGSAPLPAGDQFDQMYGIDPEKLYKEDIEDTEIQERFDRFESTLKSTKEEYNKLVPVINSKINQINNLKELIVNLSVQNLSTVHVTLQLKEIQESLDEQMVAADRLKEEIEKNQTLIKNYKDWSERKLFEHWRYLNQFGVIEMPWLDWKQKHTNKII